MDNREQDAVRLLARTFIEAGKFAAARDLLLGLAAVRPDDVFTQRNLVLVRLRLEEFAEALPLAAKLAESATGPDRAPALFYHAHALWGAGREAECRAAVGRYEACLREETENAKKPATA